MKQRLDYFAKIPDVMKTILAFNTAAMGSGLERSLLHLVKLRASQINGCSYCVDMHSKEARKDGETEQRLYMVAAWKESPVFTDRERAAFAWTEAVTQLSKGGVSDALYEETRRYFTEEELVKLNAVVAVINVWNRFAVPFQTLHEVDSQSALKAAAE